MGVIQGKLKTLTQFHPIDFPLPCEEASQGLGIRICAPEGEQHWFSYQNDWASSTKEP